MAACLTATRNPRAPAVILCGNGPGVRQAGEWLAKQLVPIPVFLKRAAHRWVYQGQLQVAESLIRSVPHPFRSP